MAPILNVGPLALPLPELLLLAGLWFGLSLSEKHAQRHGLTADLQANLVFTMLVAGLLSARAAYVLLYPAAFAASPASLLSLNTGLLHAGGGLVGAALGGWAYAQRKDLGLWQTLDALAPALGVLWMASALAQLAGGTAYGAETDWFWGIELWGASRHPVQALEAVAAGLILGRLFPAPNMANRTQGMDFLWLAAGAAATRLLLGGLRGASLTTLMGLRSEQVLAWLALATALWLIGKRRAAGNSALQ